MNELDEWKKTETKQPNQNGDLKLVVENNSEKQAESNSTNLQSRSVIGTCDKTQCHPFLSCC